MSAESHWRALERIYASAPINRFFVSTLRVGDGVATVEMRVVEPMLHAADAAHGSIYFKVLDDAAWFAAASRVADELILTSSFSVDLVRPVGAGGLLRAEGRLVSESRRVLLGESVARDEDGRLVARGHGSFMRTGLPFERFAQGSERTKST